MIKSILIFTGLYLVAFIGFNKSLEENYDVHQFTFDAQDEVVKNYALLIGVNHYQDERLPQLKNPVSDVGKLKKELEGYDFLVDTLENATRKAIKNGLRKISHGYENQEFDPEGQLIIFLSGHGVFDKRAESGYFLPADCDYDDLDATAFLYHTWKNVINNFNCKHILVIIDACYSGTFALKPQMKSVDGKPFQRPNEMSNIESLLYEHKNRTTRLALSSGGEEETPDKSQLVNQLLEAFRDRSRTDGILTIKALHANYLDGVRPVPLLQTFGDNDAGSSFLFIEPGVLSASIDPMEELLWNWVSKKDEAEAYYFFLDMYPEGNYANDASRICEAYELAFEKNTGDSWDDWEDFGGDDENPFNLDSLLSQDKDTLYLKVDGTGDGSSWGNASSDLHKLLAEAKGGDQIWTAGGTYYTSDGTDQIQSFHIPSGVSLYGGFAGTESSLQERVPDTNITTLSGEIGNREDVFDNAYTVVTFKNVDSTTVLDGFIITGGNAIGKKVPAHSKGGGIFNDGTGGSSSPTIKNCTFIKNAALDGGAIYNLAQNGHCKPIIQNCKFLNNESYLNGGGIYNYASNGTCNPFIISCTFKANMASFGASILNKSETDGLVSPLVKECYFVDNVAAKRGSGIYDNTVDGGKCKALMIGNRFEDNRSGGPGNEMIDFINPINKGGG